MTLCLRSFASISARMCLEACNTLQRRLAEDKGIIFMKGKDDPVTTTDFYVQTMLTRGLKKHFPRLKMVREESEEYHGTIEETFELVDSDILPSESNIRQKLDMRDLCLWMDPLDCTKGFIRGQMENVTILMGLTYKKTPIFGTIATPYRQKENNNVFDPVVTIGSVLEQQTYDYDGSNIVKKKRARKGDPLRMASSLTRYYLSNKGSLENVLRKMKAEHVGGRGAGHKAMLVADGSADFMVLANTVTHKWDSCAGEAVIKSMGGTYTTAFNSEIVYDPDNPNSFNKQGLLASMDKDVHQRAVKAIYEDMNEQ